MASDDMRDIWQAGGAGAAPISLADLRRKGEAFRTTIARRNLREYLGAALVALWFGYGAWAGPDAWMRAGDALVVAGACYLAFQLHRRAAVSPPAGEMGWQNCLEYHRAQLVRQRDALRGVWKWYLGPLVPGLAVLMGQGFVNTLRRSVPAGLLFLALTAAVASVLVWVGRLNSRAADGIQKQIDELEIR